MTYMLCRNKVADFNKWKNVFDSHTEEHRAAGLTLEHLWSNLDDPNEVFFLFAVADISKAKGFINAPKAAESGKASGVLDGDFHFVRSL